MPSPTNTSGPSLMVDLHQQLGLLDLLPSRWKELVYQAPQALDVREVFAVWKQLGDQGFQAACEAIALAYPGWQFEPYQQHRPRRRSRRPR